MLPPHSNLPYLRLPLTTAICPISGSLSPQQSSGLAPSHHSNHLAKLPRTTAIIWPSSLAPQQSSGQALAPPLNVSSCLYRVDGLCSPASLPDLRSIQGHRSSPLQIECMVASEVLQRHKKLQFEREVLLDPCLTWCPSSSCQAVCQLKETEVALPQLVQCAVCTLEFCSACKANWHPEQACPPLENNLPITAFLPGETSSFYKSDDDDGPIKRCPKCKVYIERDEGCAQMMCKNCKHAFCWYCLESLDVSREPGLSHTHAFLLDDFLLIHFDKGPCRNKLGHSRSSVIWHRTQVVGIFAGFGLLLLVASPFLLLATPFILCCKCKCSKGDDDPFPT
ncbi:probable E3 ubiquitin-protein ligase RNF144A-A isoform X2 [Salvelinus namaycush]|uniref:RBR-type E3 ubiquitin transferase n=1 Tax=Salvelinus namaycush TaxID=8040 RepID=A0A8U1GYG2_SALNM|nr:probable E3 ubiquitin-protein ligase RNF144A-A isoform X2 [Salvelinus namaycush]